ncbi:MAG: T9SS type A sorting domain-containing protein [Chitinophagaceae bacterium]
MKRIVFFLLCTLALCSVKAQNNNVIVGQPLDSATISFDPNLSSRSSGTLTISLDTPTSQLWQIGSTQKVFFASDSTRKSGIMTDSVNAYPIHANAWFVLKITGYAMNPIISFTHKFETSLGHDGGVVEYSFDNTSWNNVVGGCYSQVPTDSFYTAADTLPGKIPAFSGTREWYRSRFQLFQGMPIKSTASCTMKWPFYVRFRFVSDNIPDSLAGWMIRNVTLEKDLYSASVADINQYRSLDVRPNPSNDGYFYWPDFLGSTKAQITIVDLKGSIVMRSNYKRQLDCSNLNPGIYFYRVSSEEGDYSGKLIRQ